MSHSAARTGDEDAPRRRSRGVGRFIRDIVIIFLAAILISVGIKTFLVRSFYIPSPSMENTLLVNDRILVNELEPRFIPIRHGDVVVFRDPGGWLGDNLPPVQKQAPVAAAIDWALSIVGLSAPDSNDHLIKRVIGLPGDKVTCCNALGQVSVNGVPLDEPYIKPDPDNPDAVATPFSVTVPKGDLWVMGDNRGDSADSSAHVSGPTHGFVPISDVVGRAFVITWPASRWSGLGDYPDVFDGVEDR